MPWFPCVRSENTHKLAPASDLAMVELGRMTALQAAAGEKVAYQAALLRVNCAGVSGEHAAGSVFPSLLCLQCSRVCVRAVCPLSAL